MWFPQSRSRAHAGAKDIHFENAAVCLDSRGRSRDEETSRSEAEGSESVAAAHARLRHADGTKGLLPWAWAEERLPHSHNYYLMTVRPDGDAARDAGVGHLGGRTASTSAPARRVRSRARNLAASTSCVVCTDNPGRSGDRRRHGVARWLTARGSPSLSRTTPGSYVVHAGSEDGVRSSKFVPRSCSASAKRRSRRPRGGRFPDAPRIR